MHPKSYFEKVGLDTFAKQPMGTGPWKLSSYKAAVSAELEAKKDYLGTKPVWNKLALIKVPEESTRIAMLKRGEVDITGISIDHGTRRALGRQLLRYDDVSRVEPHDLERSERQRE